MATVHVINGVGDTVGIKTAILPAMTGIATNAHNTDSYAKFTTGPITSLYGLSNNV